jgi:hypothetical protein
MQGEPYNFAILKIPVSHPRLAVWEGVLASLQPALKPANLDIQWAVKGQSVLILHEQWGLIGSVELEQEATLHTEVKFNPTPFPTQQETEQAESAIRSEILKNRQTLADLYDNRERVLQILADYLFQRKRALLLEIRDWLAYSLGIWGQIQDRSVPVYFNFLIDGTPAQFGVMLRHYFPTYRSADEADEVTVEVMKPEGNELREIPAEINPIQGNIFSRRSGIEIIAHTMPGRYSLLRVSLFGDVKSWRLWDAVRQEMERLSWFHFPEVPLQLREDHSEKSPLASNQPASAVQEPWLLIPDTGNNRQIVRLWNEQCTCKEISSKVGGTEKTILNRINLLRKQYGPQIVPYRKSIQDKN